MIRDCHTGLIHQVGAQHQVRCSSSVREFAIAFVTCTKADKIKVLDSAHTWKRLSESVPCMLGAFRKEEWPRNWRGSCLRMSCTMFQPPLRKTPAITSLSRFQPSLKKLVKAAISCYKLLEAVYLNSPCMLNCYRCLSQVSDLAGIIQTWKPVAHKGPIACCEATCHFHHFQKVRERERMPQLAKLVDWSPRKQLVHRLASKKQTKVRIITPLFTLMWKSFGLNLAFYICARAFTSVDFASRTSGGSVRTRAKTTLPPKQPQAIWLRGQGQQIERKIKVQQISTYSLIL